MYLPLDDARIFFDVIGAKIDPETGAEKPTLLALHGGPGYDHATLRPYFDRFADAAQVIYVDHRGCGRSGGAPETWHLGQWADDVTAFCDALGIEAPLVFGQSFGGMVAMQFAARHPHRPARLILSSTAARFDLAATVAKAGELGGPHAADVAHRFFSDPSTEGYAEYGEVCLPLYTRTPPPAGASIAGNAIQKPEVTVHFFRNEMLAMDLRPGLAAIPCPTLVLGGAEDPVTPVICSQEIAAAIGDNARLEIFEGCGHGAYRDDPERAERLMRSFLFD